MATKKSMQQPEIFMRGPSVVHTGVEKTLLPFFRNSLPAVRQILISLRKRMTDEEIIEHVNILQADGWFELGINYTLISKVPPLPPATELVGMKKQLVELGFNPRQAILFITMNNRAIFETAEAMKIKLDTAFAGHALQTGATKSTLASINTLLKTPVERLEEIRACMQRENISDQTWITTLFRLIRQRPYGGKKKSL